MKITKILNAVMMTAAITFGGGAVYAQQSGGSLVFLVQPEPPTMAGYVSTSGPIGLLGPKIYDGLFDYDNDGKIVGIVIAGNSRFTYVMPMVGILRHFDMNLA